MPILDLNEDIEEIAEWYDGPNELWNGRRRRNLLAALPEFRLKGDKHCPSGNTHKFCGQTYDASVEVGDSTVPGYFNLDERVKGFSIDLVTEINYIKGMDDATREDYLWNPHALDEALSWPEEVTPDEFFVWNEALGMAAQHVSQIEGPCQVHGDGSGNTVEEVLLKHYAYSVKNLQVLKIESTELFKETLFPRDVYDRFTYDPDTNPDKRIIKWEEFGLDPQF